MGKESDTGKTKTLRLIMLGVFFCFTCFAMVGSLLFGSANISFQTILHTLIGNVSTTDEMVIWNIRFPRNIVGALVGGNLAVSGAILQAVMKNPLADPGIVGVSSGAGYHADFYAGSISVAYSSGFYRCYVVRMCCIFIGVEKWNQADTYYIGRCSGQCIFGEWHFCTFGFLL